MAVNTKTVKVPIGIRKALWAKITAEPDAAHPTYDTTILDLCLLYTSDAADE